MARTAAEKSSTATISISRPDGTMTPPVDMATFKQALDQVTRKGRAPMKPDADTDAGRDKVYGVAAQELRQFIERFEQLELEKKDITEQQSELMSEAKGRGYDTKVMRKIVALRKRKPDDVAEEEAVLEMYKSALGMN